MFEQILRNVTDAQVKPVMTGRIQIGRESPQRIDIPA
jgi:hypothetical protein